MRYRPFIAFCLVLFVGLSSCTESVPSTATPFVLIASDGETSAEAAPTVATLTQTPTAVLMATVDPVATPSPIPTPTSTTIVTAIPMATATFSPAANSVGHLIDLVVGLDPAEWWLPTDGAIMSTDAVHTHLWMLLEPQLHVFDDQYAVALPVLRGVRFLNLDMSGEQRKVVHALFESAFDSALAQHKIPITYHGAIDWLTYYGTPLPDSPIGETRWLLEVEIPELKLAELVLIARDSAGNLTILPSDLLQASPRAYTAGQQFSVTTTHDVTGDGLHDLLLHNTKQDAYTLFAWHAQRLHQLPMSATDETLVAIGPFQRTTLDLDDFDGDGVGELQYGRMTGNVSLTWTYCTERVTQLVWRGIEVQETVIAGGEPSIDPACRITPVMFTSPPLVHGPERLAAVAHLLTPVDWETHPNWYALLLVRLAAHQWLAGDTEQVAQTMAQIWTNSGTNVDVQQLEGIWQQVDGDFLAFCRHVHQGARSQFATLSSQYSDYSYHFGGRFNEALFSTPMGEFLCPSVGLTKAWMQMPVEQTPVERLDSAEIPILFAQEAGLDNIDLDLEWVTIVEAGQLLLVIWDEVDGLWQAQHVWSIEEDRELRLGFDNPALDQVAFTMRDLNADAQPEFVALVTLRDAFSAESDPVSAVYIADLTTGELLATRAAETSVLAELPDTAFVLPDIVDGPNRLDDVVMLPEYVVDEVTAPLHQHLEQIIDALLAGDAPAAQRAKIEALQRQISVQEINGVVVLAELQFLLAYSYEMTGDLDEAARHYQTVIEQYPTTVWRSFAQLMMR